MKFILIILGLLSSSTMVKTSEFYSVNSDDQFARTILSKKQCALFQRNENNNGSFFGCETIFDSIMCWLTTPNDSLVVKPCPDYFNGFKIDGKVTRYCNKNGLWAKTDYSGCVASHMWTFITNNSTMIQIEIVENLGHAGYGLSIFSLISAISIMLRFKKLHCPRNTIHIHLFISFLLRGCFHFTRMFYQLEDLNVWFCKLIVVTENLLIEASQTWVFIEALYLHNTIFVHVLSDNKAWLWMYIGLGWGLPCIVMSIWIGARYAFEDSGCWVIDQLNISRWIMICYPTIIILLNVIFFINITREIFLKIRQGPNTERHRYRKLTKSTFILVLVFGLYHLIFIPVELNDTGRKTGSFTSLRMVSLYYTHLFVTFQGFIVAALFCFMNGEVINELKRKFCKSRNRYLSRTTGPDARYSRVISTTEKHIHLEQKRLSTHNEMIPQQFEVETINKMLTSVNSADMDSTSLNF